MNTMNKTSETSSSYNDQEQLFPFDPAEILNNMFRLWWLCVLLAVLGAGFFCISSYTNYVPMYETSVTFTVQTQQLTAGSMGVSSYSFSYNRSTASQLAETFPSIIKSNILQDVVCNDLELTYFPCTLSASSVSGTNMFTITAKGRDPQLTYDVLQSVIKNYPSVSQYVIGITQLNILNAPVLPEAPSNRLSYRNELLKGAVLGLMLAAVCVCIFTVLRQTIRSASDIRTKLNQKCIGTLPSAVFKRHKQKIDKSVLLFNPHVSEAYKEAFRTLRTSLLNAAEGHQVLTVTSTAPGEGKTTIAANLAISLAMMNKKVLLIDADIRNPSINSYFNITASAEDSESSKTAKITHVKLGSSTPLAIMNFNIGKQGVWDVLSYKNFRKMIDQLRPRYDHIIVDTSPLGITSEPAVILQAADAAVLVVKHDTVRYQRILSVIDILHSTGANMIGCVLNNVEQSISDYGGRYGYSRYAYGYYGYGRYGYGYGYGNEKQKKGLRHRSAESSSRE